MRKKRQYVRRNVSDKKEVKPAKKPKKVEPAPAEDPPAAVKVVEKKRRGRPPKKTVSAAKAKIEQSKEPLSQAAASQKSNDDVEMKLEGAS